jgi:hypothetical protein
MSLIEIERVERLGDNEALAGFSIDRPNQGEQFDVYDLTVAGWVIGRDIPATAIEILGEGLLTRWAPLDEPRGDAAARFPDAAIRDHVGFRTRIGLLGLRPGAPIVVRAVLQDRRRIPLCQLSLRRRPVRADYAPTLQPLMLTTLGRAGTTWTMRLLGEHPRIVIQRYYPFELRAARYWLHALKLMAEPQDLYRSAHPDSFQGERHFLGYNPNYPVPLLRTPGVAEWVGRDQIERLAAFTLQSIDECYTRIAAAQDQPEAIYFAEKHRPDHVPWLARELYQAPREIFLVRDFRDVLASMVAFEQAQGRDLFGATLIGARALANQLKNGVISKLAGAWTTRRDTAHLVRYEQLIQDPESTLQRLLTFLDLEHDSTTIAGMIERASLENPEMAQHRTSASAAASIGRWRTSDAEFRAICEEHFQAGLSVFGYET